MCGQVFFVPSSYHCNKLCFTQSDELLFLVHPTQRIQIGVFLYKMQKSAVILAFPLTSVLLNLLGNEVSKYKKDGGQYGDQCGAVTGL